MRSTLPAALVGLSLLSGCATTSAGYDVARRDPMEGVNRAIFSFNGALDSAVLKPVAKGYRDVVPAPARQGVTNALSNTREPMSFVSAMLQGKFKRAFRAVDRFAINSTYGFLGTTDRAAELGLEVQPEDLGQTFAVWGIGSGPFLMLPILGPSSFRDLAGFGGSFVADPWAYAEDDLIGMSNTLQNVKTGVGIIDTRAGLIDTVDPVLEGALDPYTTMKSAYLQNRTAEILNGEVAESDGGAFGGMEEFEPTDFDSGDDAPADAPIDDATADDAPADDAPIDESADPAELPAVTGPATAVDPGAAVAPAPDAQPPAPDSETPDPAPQPDADPDPQGN